MRKILLTIILAIPMMGYCGFIDWITGYPEVKAKIEKRLEQKYHGDKFEVWDVTWSDNLGGYNFKYKPINAEYDYTYKGSYLSKRDILSANNYMTTKVTHQWIDVFQPLVDKVSKNNLIFGSLDPQSPYQWRKMKKDPMDKALHDLYSSNPVDIKKWIAEDHNAIAGSISIFIAMPRTAEGVYKTLKLIEQINNKLRSYSFYSYKLEVITYDVPKGFNIEKYYYEVFPSFKTSHGWWFEEGVQKYAWGYLQIKSCMKISEFEKSCNNYRDRSTGEFDLDLIKKYSTADRIHNLNDIVNNFYIVNDFGKPDKCDPILGCYGRWDTRSRSNILLKNSKYYQQLEKLINNQK
ncbi:hypothetical protein [Francisella sp. LA112445]|uniref:hypothetical protein n=1 Tax=Francisella sp. LA112445 TaxID=1395624 RepID=UPI001788E670|nr:hypothetical protein [Francisella sp. LA112445]QIW10357.1 hypothetical protein FIP56_06465 [Francisella sp. LA112445]